MIPGVKGRPHTKEEAAAFHEMDANCNTCRHLQRVKHPKNIAGFLYGRCGNGDRRFDAHPYVDRFEDRLAGEMVFHPDDFMGMPCWEARASHNTRPAP